MGKKKKKKSAFSRKILTILCGVAALLAGVLLFMLLYVLPSVNAQQALHRARLLAENGDPAAALTAYSKVLEEAGFGTAEAAAGACQTLTAQTEGLLTAAAEGAFPQTETAALSETADALLQRFDAWNPEQKAALSGCRSILLGLTAEAAEQYPQAAERYREAGAYLGADKAAARCGQKQEEADVLAQAAAQIGQGDYIAAKTLLLNYGTQKARALWAETEKTLPQVMQNRHLLWRDRLAAGAWYTALLREDGKVLFTGDARYDGWKRPDTARAVSGGMAACAFQTEEGVVLCGDELSALSNMADVMALALGVTHALCLGADGSVTSVGDRTCGKRDTDGWRDITAVAAGAFHSVGLTRDGAVAACGDNSCGQTDTEDWTDITAVACGLMHTLALRSDGTVTACGDNTYGQTEVSGWKDVIYIAAGAYHSVAITRDFRVLSTGDRSMGQCDTEAWEGVVAVAAGAFHTVGLRWDGTVVACGSDAVGRLAVDGWSMADYQADTEGAKAASAVKTDAGLGECFSAGAEGPWLYLSDAGLIAIAANEGHAAVPLMIDVFMTHGNAPAGIFAGGGETLNRSTEDAKLIARRSKAVLAITGDFMKMATNPTGIQIRRGVVYVKTGKSEGFALYPDGTMRLVDPAATSADALLAEGISNVWTFGPVLVRDGAKADFSKSYLSTYPSFRTAIGSPCAYHYVAVTSGFEKKFMTLDEVADIFVDRGCTLAYNLDGGFSTYVIFMGNKINPMPSAIRRLSDMVGFLTSEHVPGINE